MNISCVGLNWRTPIRLRERLAFEGDRLAQGLHRLKNILRDGEAVILSTCNRTEIYSATGIADPGEVGQSVVQFISEFQNLPAAEFESELYKHNGDIAVKHLFAVASGLDSLVLGEGQILGQVRTAYQTATTEQTVGSIFHSLFQRSIEVARRVQTETEIAKGRVSIGSAAVDFLRGVFEDFSDKTVLAIGAGKMASLTLRHLQECRPKNILISNRNPDRAAELAREMNGLVRPFERLDDALVDADIVVSSTAAENTIVTVPQFERIMSRRRGRLTAIIDLALPRDFESGIGKLDNVLLWNIDHLEAVREKTLRSRHGEIQQALKIINAEAVEFATQLALSKSGPLIGRLEREYDMIVEKELQWLFPQLNGMPIADKDKIRQFASRLKNKFLHSPKSALRQGAKSGDATSLLDALRKLFSLED